MLVDLPCSLAENQISPPSGDQARFRIDFHGVDRVRTSPSRSMSLNAPSSSETTWYSTKANRSPFGENLRNPSLLVVVYKDFPGGSGTVYPPPIAWTAASAAPSGVQSALRTCSRIARGAPPVCGIRAKVPTQFAQSRRHPRISASSPCEEMLARLAD